MEVRPCRKAGRRGRAGDIIGTVQETIVVEHRIMVPFGVSGVVESIEDGEFTVDEPICKVKMADGSVRELTMMQKWPVRRGKTLQRKAGSRNASHNGTESNRHSVPYS